MEWFMIALRKYADFSGRARRKEYWMFVLVYLLISIVIGFVLGLIGGILGLGSTLSDIVSLIVALGLLIPSISVGVRRLHDIGRSGWWILVPIVNLVFMFFDSQPGTNEYGANPKEVAASCQSGACLSEHAPLPYQALHRPFFAFRQYSGGLHVYVK
jgi:uncharacterized membrane protein YhaH (DUF805 family)